MDNQNRGANHWPHLLVSAVCQHPHRALQDAEAHPKHATVATQSRRSEQTDLGRSRDER